MLEYEILNALFTNESVDDYMTESLKESLSKLKNKAIESKNKFEKDHPNTTKMIKDGADAAGKAGNAINSTYNKGSERILKTIVPHKFYEKYKDKFDTARASVKVGMFLASKALLFGPLDWLFTAIFTSAIMKSEDVVDKKTKDMIKQLTYQLRVAKDRMTKLQKDSKTMAEDTFKTELNKLHALSLTLAKSADAAEKSARAGAAKAVAESVFDLIDGNPKYESLSGKLGQFIRSFDANKDFFKKWTSNKGKYYTNEYHNKDVDDETFAEAKKCIVILQKSSNYAEYKKAFEKLANLLLMNPKGLTIRKWRFATKNGKNEIYIQYVNTRQKITIPNGTLLYHKSSVDGIKELNPSFRSKGNSGYLYDTPRVYLTMNKNMPKWWADYRNGEDVYVYVTKENIRSAYVDPLLPVFGIGAIYIETKLPVPVQKITPKDMKAALNDEVKEGTEFNLERFDPDIEVAALEYKCLDNNYNMTDDGFTILEAYINNTDYSYIDLFEVVNHLCYNE